MSRRSRQLETAALTALVPVLSLVPFWLLALFVVWLPLSLVWSVPYWWLPLGWLALGALLFVRPVQVAVLTPLFGARVPTDDELDVIDPIWFDIAERAELPPDRYVVRILPSDELNAFACGGHLVVVTSFAVARLPRSEL